MKIGFDAKRLYGNKTGLGNYGRALVSHLSDARPDYEYHLFTPKHPTPNDREADGPPAVAPSSITSAPMTVHHAGNRNGASWRSWGMTKEFAALGLDIFHGLSNELPFNIRRSSIKTVVTIHDLIFKPYPHTYSWLDRWIYDFKFRKACLNADHVIAVSESTKRDIITYYGTAPDKISVIAPIIAERFFEPSDNLASLEKYDLPKTFLLSVGTVEPRKNLELILQALALIPLADRPPLVVVGKGKMYLRKMKKLAVTLALKNIIWLDRVDRLEELYAIYRRAQIFIYPSKYEGFGMPVVESLLAGTPVITTNVSSLPEAAGPGAILIDPDNAEALANAILALTQDAEKRESLVRAGQAYVRKNFSPDVLTDKLVALYEQIL